MPSTQRSTAIRASRPSGASGRSRPSGRRRSWRRRFAGVLAAARAGSSWLVLVAALSGAGLVGLAAVDGPATTGAEPPLDRIVLVNDLGRPVKAPEPMPAGVRTQPIGYVEDCVWAKPGSDRWHGDNLAALLRAGIPVEHARIIAERIRAGARTGTVSFSHDGVVSDAGQRFSERFSMTFGNSLCRNSRVGFEAGRVEQGDLFVSGDYFVAMPYVCGNVTRLYPALVGTGSPMISEAAPETVVLPEVDLSAPAGAPTAAPAGAPGRGDPVALGPTTGPAEKSSSSGRAADPFGPPGWGPVAFGSPPRSGAPSLPLQPLSAVPTLLPTGETPRVEMPDPSGPQGPGAPTPSIPAVPSGPVASPSTPAVPVPGPGTLACLLAGLSAAGALRLRARGSRRSGFDRRRPAR